MHINEEWLHPESLKKATDIQREMFEHVISSDDFPKPLRYVAGMDVSNNIYDKENNIYAAVVVLSYPDFTLVETAVHADKQKFPYVPGFLSFRESPALVEAFKKLTIQPDLIFVDGQGISHPRGLGIATHMGLLLNIATIGVAKSILVGQPGGPLEEALGSSVPLIWKGKELAKVLRTKKRCSPLIISPGHKVSFASAVDLVLSGLKGYRLPEPTRLAHLAANACRKSFLNA